MQIETLSQMHSDNSLVELNIVMKKTSDHSSTTSPLFLFFNPQSEIRIPQSSTRWHTHLIRARSAPLRSVPQAGSQFHGLATAIHETPGLARIFYGSPDAIRETSGLVVHGNSEGKVSQLCPQTEKLV